jgi:hypothetical protein
MMVGGGMPGRLRLAAVAALLLLLVCGGPRALDPGGVPSAHAAASVYYIAPSGSDSNPCTLSQPCADMAPFSSGGTPIVLNPGDQVKILPGTYLMPATSSPNPVFTIAQLQGTPSQPITIAATGPVTVTRATSSSGTITDGQQNQELLRITEDCFLTVQGLTVIGPKGQPGYASSDAPYGGEVEIENHDSGSPCALGAGVTVRDFSIAHANNTCLKQEDAEPNDAFIDNTLTDCGAPGATLDHGIYASGPGALIQGNVVEGSSGFGIHVYGTNVGGATIMDNTVSNAALSGILDRGGTMTVTGNTTGYNGEYGFEIAGPGPNLFADNVMEGSRAGIAVDPGAPATVLNNTFFDDSDLPEIEDPQGYGPGNYFTAPITAENNIFYQPSPGLTVFNVPFTGTASAYLDYNDYVNVPPEWSNGPSLDRGHSIYVNPSFVNPTASPWPDLHLQSGSPAIGAGTNVGLPYGGAAPDLGALCYHCAGASATPTATAEPTATTSATRTASPTPPATASPTATPSPMTAQSIFAAQTPSGVASGAYELGTGFRSSTPGRITALRYYKPAGETGTHVGHLWSSSGALLTTALFSQETSAGWQSATLAKPLAISAGVEYVVSVNSNTAFGATAWLLSTVQKNGALSTVADGHNGLFSTTRGAFPTSSYHASGYFRDLVFVSP